MPESALTKSLIAAGLQRHPQPYGATAWEVVRNGRQIAVFRAVPATEGRAPNAAEIAEAEDMARLFIEALCRRERA